MLGQELSALVLHKYLPRRFGKKGKIMSADFQWELASDCPLAYQKPVYVCTCMHALCETLDPYSVAIPILTVKGQVCR